MNSAFSMVFTPSDLALSSFEPASAPTKRPCGEIGLSVNLPAVSHLHNQDRTSPVVNRKDNPVIPLPDPVSVLNGEFLAAGWPGILSQTLNTLNDPYPVLFRNPFDFFGRGGLNEDFIAFHASSGL